MKPKPRIALFTSLALAPLGALTAAPASASEFTLLIYEAPTEFAKRGSRTPAEQQYWDAYANYGKALQEAGILRGGAALQADSEARTAMVKAGTIRVKPGAAATSRNTLGGFFIVEVDTLDTALAWAAKAPAAAAGGAVEVRPNFAAPTMKTP